jgi:hypothetical protein
VDESYYLRRADQERKRLEGHLHKVNTADKAIGKDEAVADQAQSAAASASNAGTAKRKQAEAERQRAAARRAREVRTKAAKAAADSQAKITEYERKAREAAASARKKQTDAEKRDADRQARADAQARREREREERRRSSLEAARAREVTELRQRTAELEQHLVTVRAGAPEQITVLFLGGTPEGGEETLRLDREFREIEKELRASHYRERINVAIAHAVRISDILAAFNRHDPDVVHFSGHGDTDMLLLDSADGRPHELRDEHLGLLLGAARKPIRLLVLNACFSAEQAAMAAEYVEAAIGMDQSIADDSAKTFAGQFYGSIAAGNSLGNAFLQARVQAHRRRPRAAHRSLSRRTDRPDAADRAQPRLCRALSSLQRARR